MIDTLRADALGMYGSKAEASRELDTLAQEAVIFDFAVAQSSWTRASIGSLLTSRYPRSVEVLKEKWDPLPLEVTTLAEHLASSGYHTIGLTANPQLNRSFNFDQGFKVYHDSQVLFGWMKPEAGKQKASQSYRVATASEVLREARKALADYTGSSPVYLQLLLMDVHAHEKVRQEEIDVDLKKEKEAAYLQTVRNATREVAAFIEQLSKETRFKNTLFVLTADHGEGLSDHPQVVRSKGHGNLLYESTLRVPLVVWNFGDSAFSAARIGGVTALLDLVPTVLGYIGQRAEVKEFEGQDLSPLLRGPGSVKREYAFSETQWRKVDKVAAVSRDWLFVRSRDNWKGMNPEELQKIGTPSNGAKTDSKASHPEVFSAMRSALDTWEKEHPLPKREPGATERSGEREKGQGPSKQEIEQLKSLGYL